jgi:ferredoxin
MCEYCLQHGEGKKWYLQAKNYEREIIAGETTQIKRDFIEKREELITNKFTQLDKAVAANTANARAVIANMQKKHQTQILPLAEAEKVLQMSSSITRLDCACRKARGVHNARFCFGINTAQDYLDLVGEYPDYLGKFEVLGKEEAIQLMRRFDSEGLVHMVLTNSLFIESICNCDAIYCPAIKYRNRNFQSVLKAEFVSKIDWEKCNGCRECMKMCSFGAISYSPPVEKCYINQFKCCGAGVCRAACPSGAITMMDRNSLPALANEW